MKHYLHMIYRRVRYLIVMGKWKFKILFLERPKKSKPNPTDCKLSDHINLFYWKLSSQSENLGDYLSKIVVSHFMPKQSSKASAKSTTTLYAIGSILGFRCQDAVVWGSGIMFKHSIFLERLRHSNLDIRAVRGPETRQLLLGIGKECPEVYGDPAILMPLIFQPENIVKKYKVSVILHYAHKNCYIPAAADCNIINIVTDDYQSFITQIMESSLVISSSLHGIILAETYGVPAILLYKNERELFKYIDWYHSTGRYDIVIANSIEEALTLQPMELPDLHKMQENLLRAFPSDLWE